MVKIKFGALERIKSKSVRVLWPRTVAVGVPRPGRGWVGRGSGRPQQSLPAASGTPLRVSGRQGRPGREKPGTWVGGQRARWHRLRAGRLPWLCGGRGWGSQEEP